MSQGLRDMMANRRFAIPLVILLGLCFIGLIMVGVILIIGATGNGTPVAQTEETATPQATEVPSSTPVAVASSTPRPSPTLVPMGTETDSESAGTPVSSVATEEPTVEATATVAATAAATATPQTEDELAETGLGWGLILVSSVGLAGLVVVFRRLRLAH